jgi:hypothetical protein
MHNNNEPSVEELRLKSERSRAELTNTVDQLGQQLSDTTDDIKARLSPTHLKQQAKTYFQEKRVELVGSLEKSARENPLQAVAIGAAVAYPLLAVARQIPLPIMLIGAGIWMSRKNSAAPHTDFGNKKSAEKILEVGGKEAEAENRAQSIKDGLSATAERVRDSVLTTGRSTVEAFSSRTESARESISTVAEEFSKSTLQMGRDSRDGLVNLFEHNPLLVGGVGLAIGAFLAASLPASRVESQLLGKGSDSLKSKARELTSDAIDAAKGKSAEIVEDISTLADERGLNRDAISEGLDKLSEKVASVVNRGVNASLRGTASSGELTGTNPDSYLNGDGNAGNQ